MSTEKSCNSQGTCGIRCEKDSECDDNNTCTEDTCTPHGCRYTASPKGKVCREPNGLCDEAEVCSGNGVPCPEDKLKNAGEVCRAGSGDMCDPAEKCDGVSIDCPEDIFAAAGEVCREGSGDICNPEEKCLGKPGVACPKDNFLVNGTPCNDENPCTIDDACKNKVCKPGQPRDCSSLSDQCNVGICDIADGSCKKDPKATGTVCDDENLCTDNDKCISGSCEGVSKNCDDGNVCTVNTCDSEKGCITTPISNCCEEDSKCKDNNPCTVDKCDVATGICSNDGTGVTEACDDNNACTINDTCKGDSNGTCLGNVRSCDDGNICTVDGCNPMLGCVYTALGSGVVCRPAAGECDRVEYCDSGRCPGDKFKFEGEICRKGSNDMCDPDEVCSGVSVNCPEDEVTDKGTVCRESQGDCDRVERCSGIAGDPCPSDAKRSKNAVCRPADNICDIAEKCDGTTNDCPPNGFKAQGASCADSTVCNGTEMCDGAGNCQPGTPLNCNDGNVCTTDSCNFEEGCEHENNTAPCNDGDLCTINDQCAGGVCQPGQNVDCSAINDQCNTGVCNSSSGVCEVEVKDGVSCDDGDPCTDADACTINGECVGTPKDCNDNVFCTDDSCDSATGQCVNTPNDTYCNDNSLCSDDKCDAQEGCILTPIEGCCDENSDCATNNVCLQSACEIETGKCISDGSQTGGLSCDDNNPCTTDDKCLGDVAGTCAGKPVSCDDDNPCTKDSCHPAMGCVNMQQPGTICRPAAGLCDEAEVCGNVGGCPPDGFKPNTVVCRTGSMDMCDPAESCPGNSANCPEDIIADDSTVCRPKAGPCDRVEKCTGEAKEPCPVDTKRPSGAVCRKAEDVCDVAEKCDGVNDGCPPNGFAAIDTPCPDSTVCNGAEVCDGDGNCQSGTPLDCNDSNVCTTDLCNSDNGCFSVNNTAPCDDGDPCTIDDTCSGGVCQPGSQTVDCSALTDQCNDGVCMPDGSCQAVAKVGDDCNDGDPCTLDPVCNANGQCVGTPINCNDSKSCTDDSCDAGQCVNTPNDTTCNDSNECTQNKCNPSNPSSNPTTGCVTTAVSACCTSNNDCNDNNICTLDTCDVSTGICTNNGSGITLGCNDGNACTMGDKCQGDMFGTCLGMQVNCDDSNPCTDDSCNVMTGCSNVFNNFSMSCYTAAAATLNVGECRAGIKTCMNGSFGPCEGEIIPQEEICNGKDDSCGGIIDEGFNQTLGNVCYEGTGACEEAGVIVCTADGSGTECNAVAGTPADETCNGIDDDCDGSTDEGDLCNDNVLCTTDICTGAGGCENIPINEACDDNNVCTDDICTESGCINSYNNIPCDDGDPCTTNDQCSTGVCVGEEVDCSFCDDICSIGVCNHYTGVCEKEDRPNGTNCDDGDPCIINTQCQDGECVGSPKDCDDNYQCTVDMCGPDGNCVFTPNDTLCNDNCICTEDKCSPTNQMLPVDANGCTHQSVPGCCKIDEDCVTSNPCLIANCDHKTGQCNFTTVTVGTPCDDNNACTEKDICLDNAAGVCAGTPVNCDDELSCSTDSCDPAIGCVNEFVAAGTVCRPAAGLCDSSETCTGVDKECPPDAFKPATEICRPGSGDQCDPDEFCTGSSATCPEDIITANGIICRPAAGPCDQVERCSGIATEPCPADAKKSSNAVCRPAAGPCDIAEKCDGISNICPPDVFKPENTACLDGTVCNGDEACDDSGNCLPGTPINCDDSNICTDDICHPALGCLYSNNDDLCDDGNACTIGDQCANGFCQPGPQNFDCTVLDDQCNKGVCNPSTGACEKDVNVFNGNSCNDGDPCTEFDECDFGTCVGEEKNCNDRVFCTDDSCNPNNGSCVNTPNNTDCNDGNDCTNDICDKHDGCINTPIAACCTNDNDCTIPHNACKIGICDPQTGICSFTPAAAGTLCDDNNACTENDICLESPNGGTCAGTPIDCNDGFACSTDSCDPAVGCVNEFAAAGVVCRPAAGSCDLPETCTGVDKECPSDAFKPATEICRPGSGDQCDPDEFCTGSSAACPPNVVSSAATVCRVSAGECDFEEKCTGIAGDTCPPDAKSTAVCRPAVGPCDLEESCNGISNNCPPNSFKPANTPCPDSTVCNGNEVCDAVGNCQPGTALVCNDNNVCTTDNCDAVVGCVFTNNQAPCDDGDPCTISDQCDSGSCQPGSLMVDCSALDDQCNIGVCNSSTGSCQSELRDPQPVCNDQNACTENDICNAGTCEGTPIDCNDNVVCTDDSCNDGLCSNTPNNTPCNDGNACTTDLCDPNSSTLPVDANGCTHQSVAACCQEDDDCQTNNPCQVGTCDTGTGLCNFVGFPINTPCNDSDACTENDVCTGGSASMCSGTPVNCDDGKECTIDSCDSSTGCINDAAAAANQVCRPASGDCDVEEVCDGISEICPMDAVAGTNIECRASEGICDIAENCDGVNKTCPTDVVEPQGTACRPGSGEQCDPDEVCDGSAKTCPPDQFEPATTVCRPAAGPCDIAESCPGGPGLPCPTNLFLPSSVMCRPANGPCDVAENCDGQSPSCPMDVFAPINTPCPDSTVCNGNEICDAMGNCQPGTPIVCNDGDPCTDDSCNPSAGCVFTDNQAPCDDGNPCTTGDQCSNGSCQSSGTIDCSVLNDQCTVGICNPSTGACEKSFKDGDPCEDGSLCTIADFCDNGECIGTPVNCSDGNSCTDDSCNPNNGNCINTPNDASCNDGNACTEDTCEPDGCVNTSIPNCCSINADCSTHNTCKIGICDPQTGICSFTPVAAGTSCDDNNACTENDMCLGSPNEGTCAGTPVNCDDNSECTTDTCDPEVGCISTPLAPGDVCRVASGPCDIEEVCDGTSAPCPADVVESSSTVCRAAVGPCDVAENCDGTNKNCPADQFEPASTVCRAGSGDICNPDEFCSGNSATCPPDVVASAGTECRAISGPCDVAEFCNGTTAPCPTDAVAPASTVCRAVAGPCDVAENCDGVNKTCPTDQFKASTEVCNFGSGGDICDPEEFCPGNSANCPPDVVRPATTVCREKAGDCDLEERCTGIADQPCPPDMKSTAVCRPSEGPCDIEESCDGSSNDCPSDVFQPANTPCLDATVCNGVEQCDGNGICQPGTPINCNDGEPCTDDSCDPVIGCVFTDNQAPCDDGDPCTIGDTCANGSCQTGSGSIDCSALNDQCTIGVCNSSTGACDADTTTKNGDNCDDGNPCTTSDACDDGECIGQPIDCSDNNLCTDDTCDNGSCVNTFNNDNCDDGNVCTDDTCEQNGCVNTPIPNCCENDGNCSTHNTCKVGTCDTETGICGFTPVAAGTSCDDNNACTENDMCLGSPNEGTCAGVPIAPCDDSSDCTTDTCDPAVGCVFTPLAAGTVCRMATDDCDVAETCDGTAEPCPPDGVAAAGTVCRPASDDCDVEETCDGNTKVCPADAVATAGTVCNPGSGDLCDPDEVCNGSSKSCPPDQFEPANTICRNFNGVCDWPESCPGVPDQPCPPDMVEPAGLTCRPANGPCDVAETCDGVTINCPPDGVAAAGTVCNPGSGDLCDPDEVCNGSSKSCPADQFEPASTVCRPASDDCDVAEFCPGVANQGCPSDAVAGSGVQCRPSVGSCDIAENCDGMNKPCPADQVVSAGTICRFGSGDQCDPNETCTGNSGTCPPDVVASSGTVCRASTDPDCDPAEVCSGTPGAPCPSDAFTPDNTPCGDPTDDDCTNPDRCSQGVCLSNDAPAGFSCSDGDDCNGDEVCDGMGNCLPGTPLNCDDGIGCTVDSCDSGTGQCMNVPNNSLCDDNNACTEDICSTTLGCVNTPENQGFVCRPVAGTCDVEETCPDSSGSPCPADAFAPATTVCRPSMDTDCDPAENCTGSSATCPADMFTPNGTTCTDDGDPCTTDECLNGECTSTPFAPCCGNGVVETGEQCDDGNAISGDGCETNCVCTPCTVSPFELSSLLPANGGDGSQGFILNGIDNGDNSGRSLASGDINGDGFDDVIIGTYQADPHGNDSGETYVFFGSASGFSATFELSALNGSNGFVLNGIDAGDRSGWFVSSGDINGDGIDDVIIGARNAAPNANSNAGEAYVFFGSASGFAASIELSSLLPINGGDGSQGFILNGIDNGDNTGNSVASGDINGDGIDDVIIGATDGDPNSNSNAGETYVFFGASGGFSATFNLSTLNGINGFILNGIDAGDQSGVSVASGDINGDGFDDVIIGAWQADPNSNNSAGEAYVFFGAAGGFSTMFNLSTLNGINGFILNGIDNSDLSGFRLASGDINGDGFDDVIISAWQADPNSEGDAGETYVFFGAAGGFSATFNLSTLNGINGFILNGIDAGDNSGYGISSGDINGDGFDDVIIGARFGDPSGETYVFFGASGGFSATFDLSTLNGINGFILNGIDAGDNSGWSVASGDINGDNIDDLIIGATNANPNGSSSGETYVVLSCSTGCCTVGQPCDDGDPCTTDECVAGECVGTPITPCCGNGAVESGEQCDDGNTVSGDGCDANCQSECHLFSSPFELSSLLVANGGDGSNGFILNGIDGFDQSGWSVSSGDINGDGIDDVIIGANRASPNGAESGETYVVFGSASGFPASINLSTLNGTNGFILNGIDGFDQSGASVSSGDINGDGIDDVIIGARFADPNGNSSGETYVVFGSTSPFTTPINLSTLNGTDGFILNGIDANDQSGWSVSSGDINGDGRDDVIISANLADPNGNSSGETYVVFGSPSPLATPFNLSTLDGTNGFVINGIDAGDTSGASVSSGDINGDGRDDVIIGATNADPNSNGNAGETYVVFGSPSPLATPFNLSTLDGTNGFVINGISTGDLSGYSVSSGDINGDGRDDVIIGAIGGDPNSISGAGETYVVFGSPSPFTTPINLSTLNGTNGFVINGIDGLDVSGWSVSSGDINGDNIADVVIGAIDADPNVINQAGETYVVYGSTSPFAPSINLSTLDGTNGIVINGIDGFDQSGWSVSSGDINGDGKDDVIIGAVNADPNGNGNAGETYIVFGCDS